MKNSGLGKSAFAAILIGSTAIGVILRTLCLFLHFDVNTEYFESSAILPKIMHVFFFAIVLSFIPLAFMAAKNIYVKPADENRDPTGTMIFSILSIAALTFVVAKSYFNVFVPLNAPTKIILHMSAISCMLLLTAIARMALGTMKKRFYLFTFSASFFLTAVSSIPALVAQIFTEVHRVYVYFYFDVLMLIAFTLCEMNLISLLKQKEEDKSMSPEETSEE